jgi:uncharacterized protein YlaI
MTIKALYELKCSDCDAPHSVDFDDVPTRRNENDIVVFDLTCKCCKHRGEYRIKGLKALFQKPT